MKLLTIFSAGGNPALELSAGNDCSVAQDKAIGVFAISANGIAEMI